MVVSHRDKTSQHQFFLSRLLGIGLLALAFQGYAAEPSSTPQTAPAVYHLGIFPYMAPRQTIMFYGPVAADMQQALGHPVKLESQRSFTDFTQALALHTYDIALIQPFDYPQVVEKEGYIPLARLSAPLVTQFFVRDDSQYHKLSDLRGTMIAMPPAKSANARMAMRALIDNHLTPGRDVEIRYFNSHDSCLQQVWVGNASACTSAMPPVRVFQKRMQAKVRTIYSTPPIPHVLFVADPRVPETDREILKQLIIGWASQSNGRKLLKNLGFLGFKAVDTKEYEQMRHYEPDIDTATTSAGHDHELMLGILPYITTRQLIKNFAPLLPALSRVAHMTVNLRTASTFGTFSDNLIAGKYDIVLVQPFEFEKAVQLGYIPLAAMKNKVSGTFFVRENSPYHKISDLKGKTIVMSPMESAQARLGRDALRKAGFNLKHDVIIKYVNTHDACLREVQRGEAASCITSPLMLKMLPGEFTSGLRQIGHTAYSPGVVFLANKRLPKDLREKLKNEILSWGTTREGRKILNSMQFGEFVKLNPDEYKNISELGQ